MAPGAAAEKAPPNPVGDQRHGRGLAVGTKVGGTEHAANDRRGAEKAEGGAGEEETAKDPGRRIAGESRFAGSWPRRWRRP
jgi:hypothetical protein